MMDTCLGRMKSPLDAVVGYHAPICETLDILLRINSARPVNQYLRK